MVKQIGLIIFLFIYSNCYSQNNYVVGNEVRNNLTGGWTYIGYCDKNGNNCECNSVKESGHIFIEFDYKGEGSFAGRTLRNDLFGDYVIESDSILSFKNLLATKVAEARCGSIIIESLYETNYYHLSSDTLSIYYGKENNNLRFLKNK